MPDNALTDDDAAGQADLVSDEDELAEVQRQLTALQGVVAGMVQRRRRGRGAGADGQSGPAAAAASATDGEGDESDDAALDASSDGTDRYVIQPSRVLRAGEAQAKYNGGSLEHPGLPGSSAAAWQAVLDACTARPMTQTQIARHLGTAAGVGVLTPIIENLYGQGLLANVGTDQHPRWMTRVGDHAPPERLEATIRCLCSGAPRTLQELIDLTGARQPRVNGARLQLERNGEKIVNLGSGKFARWYVLHPRLRLVAAK